MDTAAFDALMDRDPSPDAFDPARPGLPWSDPDFSRRFFEVHTRGASDTRVEVAALWKWLGLKRGQRVLDLGCGGGRTLEALAAREVGGGGVDIGPWPLEVARQVLTGTPMQVWQQDFREGLPPGPFDAAFCLYGQLTTLPEAEARRVLTHTHAALRPGGHLLLELYLGPATLVAIDGMENWTPMEVWLGGEYPQVVLDEHIVDWDASTYVRRSYALALGAGGPPLLEFFQGSEIYDEARLKGVLEACGFRLTAAYGDWEGTPLGEDGPNFIAVARRLG